MPAPSKNQDALDLLYFLNRSKAGYKTKKNNYIY
ncbi:hypothetical protein MUGA111182_05875 [Mucilaginibacter galii]